MSVNKPERVEMLQAALLESDIKLTKAATSKVYDAVNELHEKILLEAGTLTIQGFGTYRMDHLDARERRNPRTGETFTADPTTKVRFRASINLNRKAVSAATDEA